MKVVAYVPVKLNNERIPGKNIKHFSDGTPLCNFIFNTLSQVNNIDEIYCYCSSEDIIPYLPNKIKFLKRPAILDTSSTQCHEIISSFLNTIQDADIVVLCHVTSPFITKETIQKCINAVVSGKYDSAFSASQVKDFLWMDNKAINFDPAYAVRTQELPLIYKETIGCYVFTREMFLKRNGRVGFNPYICEVGPYEDIDIDYPDDFEIANAIYMNIIKNKNNKLA